jgi:integrase
VAIPPHLMPLVRAHLRDHVAASRDALLFPAASGGHMAPSSLYAVYHPAREAAGRPDLRFHDLRHTGAVLAAATGATLAELMARLGHSTVSAVLRYQHAAAERDKVIAACPSWRAARSRRSPAPMARPQRGRRKGNA